MATGKRSFGLGIGWILAALLFTSPFLLADNKQAETALHQGRMEEATTQLTATLTAQPNDARAHQLLCRVYYAQEMADQAIHECELATSDAPASSENQLWLGRSYGMKAGHANPFSAMGLAKKVHVAFERAIQLDPANIHAMSDLGEYYIDAPSLIGGGFDRAQTLITKLQPLSPAKAHRLLALLASKKKDWPTAEAEFKNAVAAGKSAEAYIDLARFYQLRNRPDDSVAAIRSAIEAARVKDAVYVDAALILTALHRSPDLAERYVRDYLASSSMSDEAPAFKVRLQLGDLLQRRGDTAGAKREYATAAGLAPNFAAARKSSQGI